VTDYDGNIYHIVQIGNQCWMRENLRTTHYADGNEIPAGTKMAKRIFGLLTNVRFVCAIRMPLFAW